MKGELHPTKNRLWGGRSCARMTAFDELLLFLVWPLLEIAIYGWGATQAYGDMLGYFQLLIWPGRVLPREG